MSPFCNYRQHGQTPLIGSWIRRTALRASSGTLLLKPAGCSGLIEAERNSELPEQQRGCLEKRWGCRLAPRFVALLRSCDSVLPTPHIIVPRRVCRSVFRGPLQFIITTVTVVTRPICRGFLRDGRLLGRAMYRHTYHHREKPSSSLCGSLRDVTLQHRS
jgi:hypothetical protein